MKTLKVYGTIPKDHPFPVISWLIRLFEWSDVSHTAVDTGDERIYHAHFNSVLFEDKEEWLKKNEVVHTYEFKICTECYDAMMEFCEGYKGAKSGYFIKLFGQAIPLFMRRVFGVYIKNTFAQGMKGSTMCTELVRYLAKRYWNFKVSAKPYSENFTTNDVKRMMESNLIDRSTII